MWANRVIAAGCLVLAGLAPFLAGPAVARADDEGGSGRVVVNVVAEGAVGDGIADDTAAFQHAISQLNAAGGGILIVPRGDYLVQPILPSLGSNIAVLGDDAVLEAAAPGYQLLDIAGAHVTLSGLTLDGRDLLVRGLSLEAGANQAVLRHDVIENFTQPADPGSPFYRAMPIGLKIYGNINGVAIDSTTVQNVVAQRPECTAASCTPVARGILISPAAGQSIATDVRIRDSFLAHVAPKDDGDCLVIQDAATPASLTVQDTTFDACSKRAIKIQVPGATIADNTIINPFNAGNPNPSYASTLPQDMYAGISVYASHVTIEDNHIGGTGTFFNGIELGACAGISDVVVRDNQIQMGSLVAGTSLIRVMGAGDHLTIEGNSGSTAVNGIEAGLSGLSNTVMRDNTFEGVTNQIQDYSGC